MLGNIVEMSLIFLRIMGSLNLRWALHHLVLGGPAWVQIRKFYLRKILIIFLRIYI